MLSLKNRRIGLILGLIIITGVFLRTFHFSNWITFNSDQARDAIVVSSMVEKNEFPLLGPVAGGTEFKIGPITYYFSYISAKIFGNAPDRMAYPDLLWGILTIPLLYFLFREFFGKNISLSLTGLYSVTYFAVQYSRFSWNPNSAQFFCPLLIFCFLKILNSQTKNKIIWIILAGLSLGTAVQLHTLLLAGMPLFFLALAIYSMKKNVLKIREFLIIIIVAIFLNIPQIINEIQTKGGNFNQFKLAVTSKKKNQSPLWKNFLDMTSCQIQSNAKILVPLENQEDCEYPFSKKYIKKVDKVNKNFIDWFAYCIKLILVLFLSLSGYFSLAHFIKKEKEARKKNFLIATGLFCGILFLVFIPFGAEISLRYFTPLAFIPFILVGLIIKKFEAKRNISRIIFLAIFLLFFYNLFFCLKTFKNYSDYTSGNLIDGTIGQIRDISQYITDNSIPTEKIQIKSSQKFDDRFFNRIGYFISNQKNQVIFVEDNSQITNNIPLFFIIDKNKEEWINGKADKFGVVEKYKKFGKITVFKIDPDKNQ